ncbi:MAG: Asp23/Gls24 family envelope stress response protein [Firmicutes bacterium]|nr:Asp23/Gls24 family envelope stress response protein [Bacillota bacterium]
MSQSSNKNLSKKKDRSRDQIRISPEVISVIAGIAVQEVAGVAGMSGGIVDGIAQRLGRKDFSKGIKVTLEEENVLLDLNVVIDYGAPLMETAETLKQKVRATVEEVTGLTVAAINVNVTAVNMPKEKAGDGAQEEQDDSGDEIKTAD